MKPAALSGLCFGLVAEGIACCVLCSLLSCASLRCFPVRVCVAFLLELTELAQPVEMPCLRCNTQTGPRAPPARLPRIRHQ